MMDQIIIIIIIITLIHKILFLLPFELSLQFFKAFFRIKILHTLDHRYFNLLNSPIYNYISLKVNTVVQAELSLNKFDQLIHEAFSNLQVYLK